MIYFILTNFVRIFSLYLLFIRRHMQKVLNDLNNYYFFCFLIDGMLRKYYE